MTQSKPPYRERTESAATTDQLMLEHPVHESPSPQHGRYVRTATNPPTADHRPGQSKGGCFCRRWNTSLENPPGTGRHRAPALRCRLVLLRQERLLVGRSGGRRSPAVPGAAPARSPAAAAGPPGPPAGLRSPPPGTAGTGRTGGSPRRSGGKTSRERPRGAAGSPRPRAAGRLPAPRGPGRRRRRGRPARLTTAVEIPHHPPCLRPNRRGSGRPGPGPCPATHLHQAGPCP